MKMGGIRDRVVVWVANCVLSLASRGYRDMLSGAIRYGMASAMRDDIEDRVYLDVWIDERTDNGD